VAGKVPQEDEDEDERARRNLKDEEKADTAEKKEREADQGAS
jgi:hypothetical protein